MRFRVTSLEHQVLAGQTRTILQVACSSQRNLAIEELALSTLAEVPANQSVRVDVVRQTSAGLMTQIFPVRDLANEDENLLVEAYRAALVEPTDDGEVLLSQFVPPNGAFSWLASEAGREIQVSSGGRLGIRVTVPPELASVRVVARLIGAE